MIDFTQLTQALSYFTDGWPSEAEMREVMEDNEVVVVDLLRAVLEADQTEAAMSTGFDSTRWMIITTVPGSGRYAVVPVETP